MSNVIPLRKPKQESHWTLLDSKGDRLARIKASLERINALVVELRRMNDEQRNTTETKKED